MSENIVRGRAKWTLQEIIPILLMVGVGLLGVYGRMGWEWQQAPSWIVIGIGFGLAAWLVFLNFNRKRKSTLYADLKEDDRYGISVWMHKPLKHKWNGKLDKGENQANLLDTRFVYMESVMSTRVIVFNHGKGKLLYVPVRLVQENDDARLYIVEAVEALGSKLKFKTVNDKKEFEKIILGEGQVYVKDKGSGTDFSKVSHDGKGSSSAAKKAYEKPAEAASNSDEEPGKGEVSKDEKEAAEVAEAVEIVEESDILDDAEREELGVDDNTDDVEDEAPTQTFTMPETVVNATRVIGYGRYEKKTLSDQINDAMQAVDARMDEAAKNDEALPEVPNHLLDLDGGGSKKSSIVIELPAEDSK